MNMCYEKVKTSNLMVIYRKCLNYQNKGFDDKDTIGRLLKDNFINVEPVRAPCWSMYHEVLRIFD